MESEHYNKVAFTPSLADDCLEAYRDICRKVADLYPKLEKPIVLSNLTRDAFLLGNSGFYSKLLFTVKTHKSPGEVKTRNVHSSVGNPVPDH